MPVTIEGESRVFALELELNFKNRQRYFELFKKYGSTTKIRVGVYAPTGTDGNSNFKGIKAEPKILDFVNRAGSTSVTIGALNIVEYRNAILEMCG